MATTKKIARSRATTKKLPDLKGCRAKRLDDAQRIREQARELDGALLALLAGVPVPDIEYGRIARAARTLKGIAVYIEAEAGR